MAPQAEVTHSAHGRTRIRVPSRRRDSEYFSRCERELRSLAGVSQVESRPLTGSLLISHRSPLVELMGEAKKRGLFAPDGDPRRLTQKVSKAIRRVDDKLVKGSGGNLDLRSVAFVSLVGLGIFQLTRGKALPAATSLFGDAFSLIRLTGAGSDPAE